VPPEEVSVVTQKRAPPLNLLHGMPKCSNGWWLIVLGTDPLGTSCPATVVGLTSSRLSVLIMYR
jgi:hypothetical protein